jgi:hypothetical protein
LVDPELILETLGNAHPELPLLSFSVPLRRPKLPFLVFTISVKKPKAVTFTDAEATVLDVYDFREETEGRDLYRTPKLPFLMFTISLKKPKAVTFTDAEATVLVNLVRLPGSEPTEKQTKTCTSN